MKIAAYEVRRDEQKDFAFIAEKRGVELTEAEDNLTLENIDTVNGAEGVTTLGRTRFDRALLTAVRERGVKYISTRTIGADQLAVEAAHLFDGLLEAHGNDEAGRGPEAGHDQMWFAVRDAALADPPITIDMFENLPIAPPPGYEGREDVSAFVRQLVSRHPQLDDEVVATALADAARLQQCLYNLIGMLSNVLMILLFVFLIRLIGRLQLKP